MGFGTEITLTATDATSGVEDIFVSLDGSDFIPCSGVIAIDKEKEYHLKYYAVDNVGNVEIVNEINLLYDITAPATNNEIQGDFHEDILSGRSKIELVSEDKTLEETLVEFDENESRLVTSIYNEITNQELNQSKENPY